MVDGTWRGLGKWLSAPEWLIGPRTKRTGADRLVETIVVVGLMVVSAVVVYSTGGLPSAYAHLFYLPILLASYYFGVFGAVLVGAGSALVVGPASALEFIPGDGEGFASWGTRTVFFVGVGVAANLMMAARNRSRSRLRQSIRQLYQAHGRSLQTFAALVALRDDQTSQHCERVAWNACVIGEDVGLDGHQLTELHWAGILHDVGKISTSAQILLKTGSLTDAEYEEIKKHASLGADILAGILPTFLSMAEGVRSHHERWDGAGYPHGLCATEIPLTGRILAVVDVFEAVTSQRPYRSPMHIEDALDVIRSGSGRHFDPAVVERFLDCHGRGRILVEGEPVPKSGLDAYPLPGFAMLVEEVQLN